MLTAAQALLRLRRGNEQFRRGDPAVIESDAAMRGRLASTHRPFAVVLGCSDARVPVELVFNQRPGDLFVVRVAGNVAAPSQIGSVEFATQTLGARLVVVLGHSHCGAVQATLEQLRTPAAHPSAHLQRILQRIRPAVESVLADAEISDDKEILQRAVRANVEATVAELSRSSELLRKLVSDRGLQIIGAEYSLEGGNVEFFGSALPA